MIVDLERNDLSRVCEPGSVRWPELMVQRELAGVTHLVSTVEGRLRAGRRPGRDPGGAVPGRVGHRRAEDRRARPDRRARAGRPRRVDGRARRRSAPNGDLDLALTIRTFAIADGRIHLWVGGGIVWDSEPEAEIEESWVKARPLLAARRRPRARMTLLAVAVAGRGLVDPAEPVFARRRRGAAARRRGVRDDRASTTAGRSCSTRTSNGSPHRRRRSALPAPDAAARRALVELVVAAGGAPTTCCGSTGPARRSSRPCAALPAELERAARAGAGRSLPLGVALDAAWLLAGVKSTSYARQHGRRGGGAPARRRRRAASSPTAASCSRRRSANIWWRRGERCYTPALEPGRAAGVTRAIVLELAPEPATASRRAASRSPTCSRPTRRSRPRRSAR